MSKLAQKIVTYKTNLFSGGHSIGVKPLLLEPDLTLSQEVRGDCQGGCGHACQGGTNAQTLLPGVLAV